MSTTKSPLNTIMNFDSFSHGQIQSKIWLADHLEPLLPKDAKIANLGSWYNVLGYILCVRNSKNYKEILGLDIDESTKPVADKLTETWRIGEDPIITNIIADANDYDLSPYNVVVNCSPEHMASEEWFMNLEYGTMVCIQSSDVQTKDDDVWKCVNPNECLEDLVLKYPLSKYLYSGEKEIRYSDDNGYKRFMLIGIK
jgi:hypothetical protein